MSFLNNPGKIVNGRDYNFYRSQTFSNTTFANTADYVITFPTAGVIFINESGSGIIEYSFNGNTVHGKLDGASTVTKSLTFLNRVISPIWVRVVSGSCVFTVHGW